MTPGSCLLEWSLLRLLCHQFEKLPWMPRRAGHSAFPFVCPYIGHTKIFCSQKSRCRVALEGDGHPLGVGLEWRLEDHSRRCLMLANRVTLCALSRVVPCGLLLLLCHEWFRGRGR